VSGHVYRISICSDVVYAYYRSCILLLIGVYGTPFQ